MLKDHLELIKELLEQNSKDRTTHRGRKPSRSARSSGASSSGSRRSSSTSRSRQRSFTKKPLRGASATRANDHKQVKFRKGTPRPSRSPSRSPSSSKSEKGRGKGKGKGKSKNPGKIKERHQLIPRHHHHQPAEGVTLPTDSKTGRDDDPDSQSDKDHGMDTGSPTAASS